MIWYGLAVTGALCGVLASVWDETNSIGRRLWLGMVAANAILFASIAAAGSVQAGSTGSLHELFSGLMALLGILIFEPLRAVVLGSIFCLWIQPLFALSVFLSVASCGVLQSIVFLLFGVWSPDQPVRVNTADNQISLQSRRAKCQLSIRQLLVLSAFVMVGLVQTKQVLSINGGWKVRDREVVSLQRTLENYKDLQIESCTHWSKLTELPYRRTELRGWFDVSENSFIWLRTRYEWAEVIEEDDSKDFVFTRLQRVYESEAFNSTFRGNRKFTFGRCLADMSPESTNRRIYFFATH